MKFRFFKSFVGEMERDCDQLKQKQSSGNMPKRQESNRQKDLFSLCSEQEQGRPSRLMRADGVLLQDDRKKAEGVKKKQLPFYLPSITTRTLIRQSAHQCNHESKKGKITPSTEQKMGMCKVHHRVVGSKLEYGFLSIFYSLSDEINKLF